MKKDEKLKCMKGKKHLNSDKSQNSEFYSQKFKKLHILRRKALLFERQPLLLLLLIILINNINNNSNNNKLCFMKWFLNKKQVCISEMRKTIKSNSHFFSVNWCRRHDFPTPISPARVNTEVKGHSCSLVTHFLKCQTEKFDSDKLIISWLVWH